jgi:hypothetical protein
MSQRNPEDPNSGPGLEPMIARYFYGFEMLGGRYATEGRPNPTTGKLSIWGTPAAFPTKAARDAWANEYNRLSVTKVGLRYYRQGLTLREYETMLEQLQ